MKDYRLTSKLLLFLPFLIIAFRSSEEFPEFRNIILLPLIIIILIVAVPASIGEIISFRKKRRKKLIRNEFIRELNNENSLCSSQFTDPDKDLRDAMIRLGYDPKIVNNVIDEVNKEIK